MNEPYTDLCLQKFLIRRISDESRKQIDKWGVQTHTLFEWLAFATEELGELSEAISEFTYRNGDKKKVAVEAIQVATLCIKIAEMIEEQ